MISCSIRRVKGGYVKSYFYFGKKQFGLPEKEEHAFTHFIR